LDLESLAKSGSTWTTWIFKNYCYGLVGRRLGNNKYYRFFNGGKEE